MNDICLLDATELAACVRAKKLSPVEIARAFLDRIDRLDPTLNAFCFVLHEQALAQAERAERQVLGGETLGLLHGVPIAFKDFTPTEGVETTLGSWAFKGHLPREDAIVVERTKRAGAILIGKTQTSEFAHSGFTRNPVFGATLNPWNAAHTPGGSSGGSAAAVAAAMTPLAEGTDAGGSVRVPSACCGTYGLRPHVGRVPLGILETSFETLLQFGPMTWTVRDAALLLSVWAGPDDRDPLSLPDSREDFLGALERDVAGMRVAYSTLAWPVDPEVREVVERAVAVLEDLGCAVDVVEIGGGRAAEAAFADLYWPMFAAHFGRHVKEHGGRMTPLVLELIERGRRLSAVGYQRAQIIRSAYYARLAAVFEQYDLIVTPTLSIPPPPVDDVLGPSEVDGRGVGDPQLGWVLTWPFSLTLHPAASIPAGVTGDGLPVGMQIAGRRFREADVLRLSARFEEARPWRDRRPVVAVAATPAEGSAARPELDQRA
jgi:Asp-tRNA(Asn)/Glu-tRNA(Gln) amidotransferase A subunit family amidase